VDPKKLRLIVLPIVAVMLALAACGSTVATAAEVSGTKITDDQVNQEAKIFEFLAGINGQVCGRTADPAQPADPSAAPSPTADETAECNRTALTNLIMVQAVTSYAATNDLTVESSAIDDLIKNVDDQVGQEEVDKQLEEAGVTRDELRAFAEQYLMYQEVQKSVAAEGADDAELQKLYDEQILNYTQVDALHILVKTKAEADDIYAQVTANGADEQTFRDLAKKESTDTGSGENGGELGKAPAGNYVPEFAAAVAELEPGEISKPVKTQYGWHVIYLRDKEVTPFEEAKTDLAANQSPQAFEDWLRMTLGEDQVTVDPSYGRWDVETLMVVPIDSTDPSESPSDGGEPVTPSEVSPAESSATP
jgi:parvulin-like peptidyl-prolyl isomerase